MVFFVCLFFYYINNVSLVVSETEFLLKELEQMLEQALEHTTTQRQFEEECGEEVNTGEKVGSIMTIRPKEQPQILKWQKLFPDIHFHYMGNSFHF